MLVSGRSRASVPGRLGSDIDTREGAPDSRQRGWAYDGTVAGENPLLSRLRAGAGEDGRVQEEDDERRRRRRGSVVVGKQARRSWAEA